MELLRKISMDLKKSGFFEDNVLYILDCENKEDLKLIERVLYARTRQKFVKEFCNLREYATSDQSTTICKSLCQVYNCLNTNEFNYEEVDKTANYYQNLSLIFYLALVDEQGYLHTGYSKVQNPLTNIIAKAFNRKITEDGLNMEFIELVNLYNRGVKFVGFDIEGSIMSIKYMVCMYLSGMKHYTMLEDKSLFDQFLRIFAQCITTKSMRESIGRQLIKVYFHCNRSAVDEYKDNILGKLDLEKTISRRGYLTKEASVGAIDLSDIRKVNGERFFKLDGSLNDDAKVEYCIKEVVSKEGIVIVYFILFNSIMVVAVEDYTTNVLSMYQTFADDIDLENTEESLSLFLQTAYITVRTYYATKLLKEEDNLTDKVEVYSDHKKGKNNNGYITKQIMVAPYKRKLANGWERSNDRVQEAEKFNIILQPDETFVNSFIRSQRYKETTEPTINTNEIKDKVKISPITPPLF